MRTFFANRSKPVTVGHAPRCFFRKNVGPQPTFRSTSDVLLPPKPKELDTATVTGRGWAVFATWQRPVQSGSRSSRLIVGGTVCCSNAAMHAIASTAAAAQRTWPVVPLVELTGTDDARPPRASLIERTS